MVPPVRENAILKTSVSRWIRSSANAPPSVPAASESAAVTMLGASSASGTAGCDRPPNSDGICGWVCSRVSAPSSSGNGSGANSRV